jgi:D-alanine-D-alanine ligase-like ATP-grasp enzyme
MERVVIIEINTLPGMTPATCIFHQAAEIGIKPMDFVDQIVQLGMKNHAHPQVVSVPKTASV